MNHPNIRLCLVLHNHQPIGNFDDVIEQAFNDSYLPFLDILETYPHIRLSLHMSGPLFVWLEENHLDYLDRIKDLITKDQVEVLGGALYEPILSMIPRRDRVGQIQQFSNLLSERFETRIRGMWIPERVWEASHVSELAEAGIEYTILDDFHFLAAGLETDQLPGSFVSEDQGRVIRVFPGSEKLRYTIPFQPAQVTIEYLHQVAHRYPGATVVFADDGEKFGTWPETKKHVFDDGWLKSFFDLIVENQSWLTTCTLNQSVQESPPVGKVYLPAASYREMTEWSMPVSRQIQWESVSQEMQDDRRWERLRGFIRGGFWRNFRVKYSEANEMYARMMHVSQRLQVTLETHGRDPRL